MAVSFSQHKLVVAFDFGTTFSGYAYSYRDAPTLVQTNEEWDAGVGNLASMKTPTCVLLNPDREFDSFGYDAENKYSSLAAEGKHKCWLLFRRFKMLLHSNENVSRKTTVQDINGVSLPAVTVFTMAIRYLKDHLFNSVDFFSSGFLKESDIQFVLTVPAIWNDNSKHFMREAAVEAGLPDSRLKLCREPEAASIYCQSVYTLFARPDQPKVGTAYMVVDLGGGTADIYVHEKLNDQTIKELYKASGGPWGGNVVDSNYLEWLTTLFGQTAMQTVKDERMCDYFDLLRDFEVKKRTISSETEGMITFNVSKAFMELYEQYESVNLSEKILSLGLIDLVTFLDGTIDVDASVVKSWFDSPVNTMVDHVLSVLARPNMQRVENILLVGGFGESKIVQDIMRRRLANKTLTIPPDPGMTVLKGAVRFGHLPAYVSARVIKVRSELNTV